MRRPCSGPCRLQFFRAGSLTGAGLSFPCYSAGLRHRAAARTLLFLLHLPRLPRAARRARPSARGRRWPPARWATAVFGAFLPDPPRAPATRRPHRPGELGAGGSAPAFGLGMALSGSCISAHLYRLGEGSPRALRAVRRRARLSGSASPAGTPLPRAVPAAPVSGCRRRLRRSAAAAGAARAARVSWLRLTPAPGDAPARTLAVPSYAALAGLCRRPARRRARRRRLLPHRAARRHRGTRQPGAHAGRRRGALPARLEGLDSFRGCATAIKETLLRTTASSCWAGARRLRVGACRRDFKPSRRRAQAVRASDRRHPDGLGRDGRARLHRRRAAVRHHGGALSGWVFLACCGAGLLARYGVAQPLACGGKACALEVRPRAGSPLTGGQNAG